MQVIWEFLKKSILRMFVIELDLTFFAGTQVSYRYVVTFRKYS